ncbi:hypothetical protein WA026_020666 [Henosepilachna vigintioctopunctata]|uniref:Uncharacterized protein n=1 Tax=Henosepilachna vigintioctopunctata TaxID=420089 RepID=A0AAW1UAE1_9CUCU
MKVFSNSHLWNQVTPLTSEKLSFSDSKEKLSHLQCEDFSTVKPQQKSEPSRNDTTNVPEDSTLTTTRVQSEKITLLKETLSSTRKEFSVGQSSDTSELTTEYNVNRIAESPEEKPKRQNERSPLEDTSLKSNTQLISEKRYSTDLEEKISPLEDISSVIPQQKAESRKNYDTNVPKDSFRKETMTLTEKYYLEPAQTMITKVQSPIDSVEEESSSNKEESQKELFTQREQYAFPHTISVTSIITKKQPENDTVKTESSTPVEGVVIEQSPSASKSTTEYKISTAPESSDGKLLLQKGRRSFEQASLTSVIPLTPEKRSFIDSKEKMSPLQSEGIEHVKPLDKSESPENYDTKLSRDSSRKQPTIPTEKYASEHVTLGTLITTKVQSRIDLVEEKPFSPTGEFVIGQSISELTTEYNMNTTSEFSKEKLMPQEKESLLQESSLESVTQLTSEKDYLADSKEELLPLESEDNSSVTLQQKSEAQKNYDMNVPKEAFQKELITLAETYALEPANLGTLMIKKMQSPIDSEEEKSSSVIDKFVKGPLLCTEYNISTTSEPFEEKPMGQNERSPFEESCLKSVTPLTSKELGLADPKHTSSTFECGDISSVKPQHQSDSQEKYDTNALKDVSQKEPIILTEEPAVEPAKSDMLMTTKVQCKIDSVEGKSSSPIGR